VPRPRTNADIAREIIHEILRINAAGGAETRADLAEMMELLVEGVSRAGFMGSIVKEAERLGIDVGSLWLRIKQH
jgi:deoxyribose-phosphate aldolase